MKQRQYIFWAEEHDIAVGPAPEPDDLLRLFSEWRKDGVGLIVSAQTEREAATMGLDIEETFARTAKLGFLRIPVPDHSAPPFSREVLDSITYIADTIDNGKKVFVHCYAGIGRSPALAAAVMVHRGATPREAVQALRAARGIPVPETQDQMQFIFDYAEYVDSMRQLDE
jgi:protein-tyrosine phosphatase